MIIKTREESLRRARRAFLRGVGRTAVALPFYRLLESSAVSAAPGDLPQRFIGLYAPHGIAEPLYNRRPGESETNFSLTFPDSVLSPFDDAATYGKSWKDKVTTIEGIDLAAGVEKSVNGHDAACVMLTGSAPASGRTENESLDQFLAVTHGLGAKTKFSSVVLGVGSRKTESGENISYARGGAPLPKTYDPAAVFNMLFSDLAAGSDPAGRAALERARANGKSVLDYLRKEIARLEPRLAAPEKVKLEQHLTSLRELEKQLPDPSGAVAAGPGCRAPAKPNPAEFPKLVVYAGGEPYLDKITDLQIDLLAQAMACDLTRFGTLFIALTADVHNGVAHAYDGPRGSRTGSPSTWLALGKHNRAYFAKCARLMQRLDSLGILDSTLIYMSSDMGNPSLHSLRNVPTVLAGGANGKIKMGRRIVVEPDCPPNDYYCKPPKLTANNKILVAIAQAFGVNVNTYGATGDPAMSTGALPGLL